MRRTHRALVEITVETTEDDEYNSHDLAEALFELDLAGLVPGIDIVIIQTSAQDDPPVPPPVIAADDHYSRPEYCQPSINHHTDPHRRCILR